MTFVRDRAGRLARHAWRAALRRMPDRSAQLYLHVRELLLPQPWTYDEAAVELFERERAARGELRYPNYLYGMLSAARTAVATGRPSFSAVEFGVAGGNGLRALEEYAEFVETRFPLKVEVFGLDSGAGLLQPRDPKDCGFALQQGEFAMDERQLRAALTRAELILGPVEDTVQAFVERARTGDIPPIGFVAHDLDVFTGTAAVLDSFSSGTRASALLPRVPMYFDDLSGYPYTDEVGEWAAIDLFNRTDARKIGQIANLAQTLGGLARVQNWPRHFFVLHVFDHPDYNAPEKTQMYNLGLRPTHQ